MTDYLAKLKALVVSELKGEKIKIILFGSRAEGRQRHNSDVDIGLISHGKINPRKLTVLKDKVENLNIPYKIEIVDFSEVSEDFKKEALKEALIWKD